ASFVVQVVFTGNHALGFFRLGHADAMGATRSVSSVGALAFDAPEGFFQRRSGEHAQDGRTISNQRNVDGKFAGTLSVIFSAVDGVDQPEAAPVFALFPGRLLTLFRQDGDVTADAAQPLYDKLVAGEVCRGNGRLIFLVVHFEIGLV